MSDVSVVIPCYNGQAYIGQTIESVLAQSDPPREVFVIDDGSTDDSVGVIEKYARGGGGVTLIRQANAGESRARNVGIERASCAFVAFLDADDVWLAEKTARQLEAFERFPEAVGVHCRVFNFERELDDLSRSETERTMDDPGVEDLILYHYVTPSAAMVRRGVLVDRGLRYDEAVRHSEDMLFFADVRLAGRMRLVDEPLLGKRRHQGQQSKNVWHGIYSLESRVNWCRQREQALGAQLFAKLNAELGKRMVDTLEDRYWRRQVDGFGDARRRVARLYPELVAGNAVVNRRIYPRWVYRLRDLLTGRGA